MGFRLIAITPPYIYNGEAKRIEDALTGKFDRVHIRKPEATADEISELLSKIPERLRSRLTLHDHHELAETFGIGGIHLNRRNPLKPDDWEGIISRSVHSPAEAEQGADEYDYQMLSPVFASISKPGYKSEFTFEAMLQAANKKTIALGGVTFEELTLLEESGFGGAAMLTEAWRGQLNIEAFRLQFITHPRNDMDVVEEAKMVLEGGCQWIQLRHKDADDTTLMKEAKAIARLCRQYGATFIIDDHVELVEATGAAGVHLGKNDMPVEEARRILGPSHIIGATANTFEELESAAKSGADYAGVGPYRFTTTKLKLAPTLGTDGYRQITRREIEMGIRMPIVAIGGITCSDIPDIMSTGVQGIAASGTILNADDPTKATEKLLATINDNIK